MNRTDLLYALREELRRAGPRGRSAERLARTFEVSVRTIKRDISALQQGGFPVWAQPGPGGGYVVDAAATLPPVNFTDAEVSGLAAAVAAHRGQPFDGHARAALAKVLSVMDATTRERSQRLGGRIWIDHEAGVSGSPQVRRAVEQALHERRVLSLRYRDEKGDIDDSLYVSLDEATKYAEVDVVYAKSFYAGSGYPSGPLSGEIIGMLAGPTPAEVRAGVDACISYCEEEAWFYSADEAGELNFFPHLISSTGSYLSKEAGIPQGQPLAYLIAPPLEATFALDLAIKAADVSVATYFEPPSETNFAGGWLTGSQSACRAACSAFQDGVLEVAANPKKY